MTELILILLTTFTVLSAFLPFSRSGHWFIRAFDFPRLQFFVLELVLIVAWLYFDFGVRITYAAILLLLASVAVDAYRIFPYIIPFKNSESKKLKAQHTENGTNLTLLSVNVRAKNKSYNRLLDLVAECTPSVIVLLEVTDDWVKALMPLQTEYGFYEHHPKDNTYGISIYSKYPMVNTTIRHLVDKNVPSIFTNLKVNSRQTVQLVALHPRPPRPSEGPSDERDAELMLVSEFVKNKNYTIVAGDLNDVAWSHTTRLFLRNSQLKDPRRGRGLFNTFPAMLSSFGLPFDHIFHGKGLINTDIAVLDDIGSDHLPLYAEYIIKPRVSSKRTKKSKADKQEVNKKIKKGKKWRGPNQEVNAYS